MQVMLGLGQIFAQSRLDVCFVGFLVEQERYKQRYVYVQEDECSEGIIFRVEGFNYWLRGLQVFEGVEILRCSLFFQQWVLESVLVMVSMCKGLWEEAI